jgi:hypothetical protein
MKAQDFINNWNSNLKQGQWIAKKIDNTVYENEELFLIIVELEIKINSETRLISKKQYFQTSYKTFSKEFEINPMSDEIILENILNDLKKQLDNDLKQLGINT